jgi:hypothetical protein
LNASAVFNVEAVGPDMAAFWALNASDSTLSDEAISPGDIPRTRPSAAAFAEAFVPDSADASLRAVEQNAATDPPPTEQPPKPQIVTIAATDSARHRENHGELSILRGP